MKKLLYLALFVLLLSSYGFYLHGSGATGGGSCSTERDDETDGTPFYDEQHDFGRAASSSFMCAKFEAQYTTTICRWDFTMECYAGDCTATNVDARVGIYADDGGTGTDADPTGSPIGGNSDTVDMATAAAWESLGTEYVVSFTGLDASITDGTLYWVCAEAISLDGTNRLQIAIINTDGAPASVELIKAGDAIENPMDAIDSETRTLLYTGYSE